MNNLKIYLSILIVSFFVLVCTPAFSQTIPQNLSNINVDDLTDQQIMQLLYQAQKSGLSDDQIIQQAQAKGMSGVQIQKLQNRIQDIRSKKPSFKKSNNDTSNNISNGRRANFKQDTTNNNKDTSFYKKDLLFDNLKPKIFGADLFRNSNTNTFIPNLKLATPINYIIGPEDQININVYGNSSVDWSLDVSPDGNINIPGVGILNVAGKTIEEATRSIKNKLIANNYTIGKGTNVKVSLGNIRSIQVIVQGQVIKPGTYTLPSLATVFNALYAAGGPNDVGSFRQIEVIRNNRVIRHLDLYDFLVKGSQKDNISLQDQDVIRVPTYKIRVELRGEVKVPALFEVLPGESLQNVLEFSGGFTDEAYTVRIKVDQVSNQQRRITDVFENDYKTYIPSRGDKYTIDKIIDRYENRVQIQGAVFRPGIFELQKGLTISQLIKNAGGLKEDAFTGRGSIVRLNPDNTTQQLSFNVRDVLDKKEADIPLQREDSVTVSSIFDLRSTYKVTIKGQIRNPGDYIFADSMRVADLVVKAGGFSEGASGKRIEVSRRVFDSNPMVLNSKIAQVYSVNIDEGLKIANDNFTLKPYDIVSVYSLPGYETQKVVKVEGEVLYPGYYTVQTKNERVSDIIKRAGGLTKSADVDGSSLRRDNDDVLGVDKSKLDSTELNQERIDNYNRFQNNNNNNNNGVQNNGIPNGGIPNGGISNNSALNNGAAYNRYPNNGLSNNGGLNGSSYYGSNRNDSLVQFRNNYIGIDLRKILQKPGGREDLILEDQDVVRVPKQQQTVRVNGEVLYPSAIIYSKGKSFRGYVLNAGGFTPQALRRGAYVVYPNGTVKGTRKFLFFNSHPRVKPGSEIYVPKKPESKINAAQQILGLTTGLASLGAIILGVLTLMKK